MIRSLHVAVTVNAGMPAEAVVLVAVAGIANGSPSGLVCSHLTHKL
jgi:hypothetical protein